MSEKLVEAYMKLATESNSKYDELREINLEDIEIDEMLKCAYEIPIKGMVKCPDCRGIFCEEDYRYETTEEYTSVVYDGFDNYHEETEEIPVTMIQCPLCNYQEPAYESQFYEATTGDLIDAPNKEELLPGITEALKKGRGGIIE